MFKNIYLTDTFHLTVFEIVASHNFEIYTNQFSFQLNMASWNPFVVNVAKREIRRELKKENKAARYRAGRFTDRRQIKRLLEKEKRLVANYENVTSLCFNCYTCGHKRKDCKKDGIIACSHCFTLNRFTITCNCRKENNTEFIGQVFRLAGDANRPLFYIDIQIMLKLIVAQMSNGQGECTINHALAKWLTALLEMDDIDDDGSYMIVPITHRNKTLRLKCRVIRYQIQGLILGTEFLMQMGFNYTFDHISLNQNSVLLPDPYQLQRLYNLVPRGDDLREYMIEHGATMIEPTQYDPEWPTVERAEEPEICLPSLSEQTSDQEEEYLRLDVDTNLEEFLG